MILMLSALASILPTIAAIVIVLATIHRARSLYRTAKRHTSHTRRTSHTTAPAQSSRDSIVAAAYLRSIGR